MKLYTRFEALCTIQNFISGTVCTFILPGALCVLKDSFDNYPEPHGIYTNIAHVQPLRKAILHQFLPFFLAFMILFLDRLPETFKLGLSQYIFASDHPKPLF